MSHLTMIVSQHIEQFLQHRRTQPAATDEAIQELFPLLRLAAVLQAFSGRRLHLVYQKARGKRNPIDLTALILKEARDPNRSRDS